MSSVIPIQSPPTFPPLPADLENALGHARQKLSDEEADQNELIIQSGVGNTTRMQELINSNVDITATYIDVEYSYSERRLRTALFHACSCNKPAAIHLLIETAKTKNVISAIINARRPCAYIDESTPLHALLEARGSKSTFDMLVKAGADFKGLREYYVSRSAKATPLHILFCKDIAGFGSGVCAYVPRDNPITKDIMAIALELLSLNTDRVPIRHGITQAVSVIPTSVVDIIIEYFGYHCPELINAQIMDFNNWGHTPLSFAALGQTYSRYKKEKDSEKNTAHRKRRVKLVKILILSGGDLSVKMRLHPEMLKMSPLAHGWWKTEDRELQTILKEAAENIPDNEEDVLQKKVERFQDATSICFHVSNCFKAIGDFFGELATTYAIYRS